MTSDTHVLLGGRYLLTERIASGGMGEVWAATDQVLGRGVAVKILRREYAEDATFLERFRAEARHAAGLSHSGVAVVYDYGEDDGSPFMVLEHVPGDPLSVVIARDGPLDADRALDLVCQAAFALDAAHSEGVIHRDVKPGNLIVTPEGILKITDFGISRVANSVPLTRTGAIMGTAQYISPEQASGRPVTHASDIYSLGIVAYECLSGRLPFSGNTPVTVALAQVSEPPPDLPAGVPAPVRDLVMRMLAKDPARRPATAGDVGREAAALRDAGLVAAPEQSATHCSATQRSAIGDAGDTVFATDPAGGASYPPGTPATAAVPAVPAVPAAPRPGRVGTDTDPGFELPAPRRRPVWLPATVASLVTAMLLLGLVRACAGPATQAGDAAAGGVAARPPGQTVTVGPAGGRGKQVERGKVERGKHAGQHRSHPGQRRGHQKDDD